MTSAKFITGTTSASGSTWVSMASSTPVTYIHVLNATGTNVSFRRVGDTSAEFVLPTNMAWSFRGIWDASQIQYKRTDSSNTPVTFYAELEFEA